MEELTATITNITDAVSRTAGELQRTTEKAENYAQQADAGHTQMRSLMEEMDRINETSKKIQNIIADIEDIASQTNLLSLNAAIRRPEQEKPDGDLQWWQNRSVNWPNRVHSRQ